MNSLISRYNQYLNKLSQKLITQEFKYYAIKRPLPFDRKKYIDLLLQGNPEIVSIRVKYFQKLHPNIQISNNNHQELEKLNKVRNQQIRSIQEKIKQMTNQIYRDLSTKYDNAITSYRAQIDSQNGIIQKQKPYDDNLLLNQLIKITPLQLLMNAQTQIVLPQQTIKFDHQFSNQQIINNYFTTKNTEQLQKKVKQLEKTMLPSIQNYENNFSIKKNLLMLFGIKKEQQFLHNLQDPLEKLLSLNKKDHQIMINHLIRLMNVFDTRRQYYGIIIETLEINKLKMFLQSTKLLKESMNLIQISKHYFFLRIASNVVSNEAYLKLRSNFKQGINSSSQYEKQVSYFLDVQYWLFHVLREFRQFFLSEHCKNDQILLMNELLREYNKIKMNRSIFLNQLKTNQFESKLKQMKINEKYKNIFEIQGLSQQFHQKIVQLILFLDSKDKTKLKQYLSLYKTISEIYQISQQLFTSQHLILKVIEDLTNIFQDYHPNIQQEYSNDLKQEMIQFIISILFKCLKQNTKISEITFILLKIWQPYLNIHKKLNGLNQTQGKYFIMIIHLLSICNKHDQKIKQIISSDQFILEMIHRQIKMLKNNNQNNPIVINRNCIIFELFQSVADQLFSQIKQKDFLRTVLKQFQQLAKR